MELLQIIGWLMAGLIGLGAYFLPTIVAGMRDHSSTGAIGALNLLLGWTFLGWVVALVWSLAGQHEPTHRVGRCLEGGE